MRTTEGNNLGGKMTDTLNKDASMGAGDELIANKGNCKFSLQGDGNIVLYRIGRQSGSWEAYWSPQVEGRGGAKLVLQDDGNLVLYTGDNGVVWKTDTDGVAVTNLVLQDDEHLVLYKHDGSAAWKSDTFNATPYDPGTCAEVILTRDKADSEIERLSGLPQPLPPELEKERRELKRISKRATATIAAKGC